jgi:hypothetical protein
MKVKKLTLALLLTFPVSAFALDAPQPFEPNEGEVFDLNSAATFYWNKVSGATKYQLVFSTDKTFSSFDEKKNKCSNKNTCATFTISKISYKLPKTHAFMKKDASYFWKIRAYKGTTKSAFSDSYQFHVGEPTEETPDVTNPIPTKGDIETFKSGSKTFSYTKIANNGSELPKTAKLGSKSTDWACTKDNNTGLIWEVKTNDGGLRDMKNTYTNYDEIYPKCDDNTWGGIGGFCKKYGLTGKLGDSTNTDGFVKSVNKQGLCGAKDWRLPKAEELSQLVVCSDGKYSTYTGDGVTNLSVCEGSPSSPTINNTYFPDITENYWFWSSSPFADFSDGAWFVAAAGGYSEYDGGSKVVDVSVRLVR